MVGSIEILHGSATSAPDTSEALLLPIFEDAPLSVSAAAVDGSLQGLLTEMRERKEFSGETYRISMFPTFGKIASPRVAMVGLGKAADCTHTIRRQAVAAAVRAMGKRGYEAAVVTANDFGCAADLAGEAAADGAVMATYCPDPYRTGERRSAPLRRLRILAASETSIRRGETLGHARNLARGLVNEPGNKLDAPELARRAAAVAADVGLNCELLGPDHLSRLGMGAFLAVARGSETPPALIVLRHVPKGTEVDSPPRLALIGKAVTFDTGGISLKPAAEMGRMKGDMAGGAAVLGAMQAIAALEVPIPVLGLIPAVNNMPDGRAWMPGDVVTAMSGKTIETISTDAEGRMLLADAVHYARTLGAQRIVDVATLTGACVVALGHVASGLYGTDASLVEAVRACGEDAGEHHWPMPLFHEYRELIRSEIADLKNSGGRAAGSVTGAWFIREFAGDTPWAHLDIAGSSQYDKARPWAPAGPTGTGVGTFVRLAEHLAQSTG